MLWVSEVVQIYCNHTLLMNGDGVVFGVTTMSRACLKNDLINCHDTSSIYGMYSYFEFNGIVQNQQHRCNTQCLGKHQVQHSVLHFNLNVF